MLFLRRLVRCQPYFKNIVVCTNFLLSTAKKDFAQKLNKVCWLNRNLTFTSAFKMPVDSNSFSNCEEKEVSVGVQCDYTSTEESFFVVKNYYSDPEAVKDEEDDVIPQKKKKSKKKGLFAPTFSDCQPMKTDPSLKKKEQEIVAKVSTNEKESSNNSEELDDSSRVTIISETDNSEAAGKKEDMDSISADKTNETSNEGAADDENLFCSLSISR